MFVFSWLIGPACRIIHVECFIVVIEKSLGLQGTEKEKKICYIPAGTHLTINQLIGKVMSALLYIGFASS
jgi:hypothetical protein